MNNKNNSWIIVAIIAVAVLLFSGIFGFGFRNYGMMYGYGDGFMLYNGIFSILIIVLIVAGIYWLIKNSNHTNREKIR